MNEEPKGVDVSLVLLGFFNCIDLERICSMSQN